MLFNLESISSSFESISEQNESTSLDFEATLEKLGASTLKTESSSTGFKSISEEIDALPSDDPDYAGERLKLDLLTKATEKASPIEYNYSRGG
jgi:hypothetical protein